MHATAGGPRGASEAAQDALIGAALTATSLVGVLGQLSVDLPEGAPEGAVPELDALGVVLIFAQTTTLAWRRRAPVLVLSIVTAALFTYSVLGYFPSFSAFGFLIALYTVAAHRERRISVPAGFAAGSVVLLIVLASPEPLEPDAIIASCSIVGCAWFIGDGFRTRRGRLLQLEDRASRLEREQRELTEEAVTAERRQLARELHDVVAHNVSVIVAQSAAAQRISAVDPEDAIASLGAIEASGREALTEMRRLMGLLRDEHGGTTGPARSGLRDLDSLASQMREAGLPVQVRVEGVAVAVPAALDLSAFRIVQEALTNVLRHAGPASVDVTVRYTPARLELRVDDDGEGPSDRLVDPMRPRYGHLGMRERIALFGGELAVGPRPGGGYRVAAWLPYDRGPA